MKSSTYQRSHFQFPCTLCGAVFKKKENLRRHFSLIHESSNPNQQQFECQHCKAIYSRSYSLKTHLKSCPKLFPDAYQGIVNEGGILEMRINIKKGDKDKAEAKEDPLQATEFVCNVCGKNLFAKDDLIIHRRIHGLHKKAPTGNNLVKVCEICQMTFKYQVDLKKHQQEDHPERLPDYACEFCSEVFHLRRDLYNHRLFKHFNEPLFIKPKPTPKAGFKNRGTYHINSKYISKKNRPPINCPRPNCDAVLITRKEFNIHQESIHPEFSRISHIYQETRTPIPRDIILSNNLETLGIGGREPLFRDGRCLWMNLSFNIPEMVYEYLDSGSKPPIVIRQLSNNITCDRYLPTANIMSPVVYRASLPAKHKTGHLAPCFSHDHDEGEWKACNQLSNLFWQHESMNTSSGWSRFEVCTDHYATIRPIHVFSGTILGENPEILKTSDGRTIAIPEFAFKLLVTTDEKITKYYHDSFIFNNLDKCPKDPSECRVTLQELNRRTGLKLLSNIKDICEPKELVNDFIMVKHRKGKFGTLQDGLKSLREVLPGGSETSGDIDLIFKTVEYIKKSQAGECNEKPSETVKPLGNDLRKSAVIKDQDVSTNKPEPLSIRKRKAFTCEVPQKKIRLSKKDESQFTDSNSEYAEKDDIDKITGNFIAVNENKENCANDRGDSAEGRADIELLLREQFKAYGRFADKKHITLSNCDEWMKQAKVIDRKKITTMDAFICFNNLFKTAKKISFEDFKKYVEELAKSKKIEPQELLDKLANSGPPGLSSATRAAHSNVVDRLTDTSKYTGSHKERFDNSGKGRGIEGRKDVSDGSGYVAAFKEKLDLKDGDVKKEDGSSSPTPTK